MIKLIVISILLLIVSIGQLEVSEVIQKQNSTTRVDLLCKCN